jgi:hypothetical protein
MLNALALLIVSMTLAGAYVLARGYSVRQRAIAILYADAQAQALPVKLVFPLVICFLPGIFISTLAPVLYQMVQVADSVLRSSGR